MALLWAGLAPSAAGQEDALKHARELAFNKQRTEALTLLEDHLRQTPADTDARTFYGIVLSWEGRYDQARHELETVLEQYPDHGDALLVVHDVEVVVGAAGPAVVLEPADVSGDLHEIALPPDELDDPFAGGVVEVVGVHRRLGSEGLGGERGQPVGVVPGEVP